MDEWDERILRIVQNERARLNSLIPAIRCLREEYIEHIVELTSPVGGIFTQDGGHHCGEGGIVSGLLEPRAHQCSQLVFVANEIFSKFRKQPENDLAHMIPSPSKLTEGG